MWPEDLTNEFPDLILEVICLALNSIYCYLVLSVLGCVLGQIIASLSTFIKVKRSVQVQSGPHTV